MPVSIQDIYIDQDSFFKPRLFTPEGNLPFFLNQKIEDYLTLLTKTKNDLHFYIICKNMYIDSKQPNTLFRNHKEHNTTYKFTAQELFSLLKQSNPELFTEHNPFSFIAADQISSIKDDDRSVLITNDQTLKDAAPCDVVSIGEPEAPSQQILQKPIAKSFELNEAEFAVAKTQMQQTAEEIKIERASTEKTSRTKLIYSFDIDDTMINLDETLSKKYAVLNKTLVNKIAESINDLIKNGINVTDQNEVEFIILSARLHDDYYNDIFFKTCYILPIFILAIKNITGIEIKFSNVYCLKGQIIVTFSEKGSDGVSKRELEKIIFYSESETSKKEEAQNKLKAQAQKLRNQFQTKTDSIIEVCCIPLNDDKNLMRNKAILAEHFLLPTRAARGEKITLIQFDDDSQQLAALKKLGKNFSLQTVNIAF